ncbi:MAG: YhgE/Pip domain-containing protein [Inconstantimicrobium porci]|uniref:YhgE/Pip domain-containing protein n=1 Tax=Inconstantimicrobium porci TaxID=2652291 RepID=UPI002409B85E|nr:YhgE/Pip domain-containing protein [Inconstantimicrobium porci]MDD6771592.1 YhgE/Pip domain-containing protein [Inconstantimicrobium porci]MDY5910757.1 YhgE/Pip domain-containing protein [Inconstantimicrobium porci]
MRNILRIFKDDLVSIKNHKSALVVAIALCILPSLYAWFNIKASWNPYSSEATSGIKVAVTNDDKGTTLKDKNINIGEKVIDKLKANKSLGWQFVDKETADKNLKEGRYYASIEIPEDFSQNITSIVNGKIKKGKLIYKVNEKINAIAPKLTDKGATTLQQSISETITSTIGEVIFTVTNEAGITIENSLPQLEIIYNKLLDLQSHFGDINNLAATADTSADKLYSLLTDAKDAIPKIENIIDTSISIGEEGKNLINNSKDSVNNIASTVKKDLNLVNDIASQISSVSDKIINGLDSNLDNASAMIDSLKTKAENLKAVNNSLINVLQKINNSASSDKLQNQINKLNTVSEKLNALTALLDEAKTQITSGNIPTVELLAKIKTIADDISSIITSANSKYESDINPVIKGIISKGTDIAQNTEDILKDTKAKIPEVSGLLETALKVTSSGKGKIAEVKSVLPQAENKINEIIGRIQEIKDKSDILDIINILKSNADERSSFLADPVEIEETRIFPMANYGTAMTPFYTVLSLWVGLLLLTSIFSTDIKRENDYRAYEKYFGKMMLFMLIAVIQAIIVSVGDLLILRITAFNPVLFVVVSIFASIVFVFIVYSLVSVLGNVGKVIGIILLVLQVAGSGGTFPIQLTPHFFQVIYAYLPFTYAISFAREAIGGVVMSVLMRDIIILLVYIVIFVVLSLLLKKKINEIMKDFSEDFERSGLE